MSACPDCGHPDPLPLAVYPSWQRFCKMCGTYYWPKHG